MIEGEQTRTWSLARWLRTNSRRTNEEYSGLEDSGEDEGKIEGNEVARDIDTNEEHTGPEDCDED